MSALYASPWVQFLWAPILGGIVVLMGQFVLQLFLNPLIARNVKRMEMILQRRHETAEHAVRIALQILSCLEWRGPTVPSNRKPDDKMPSEHEINTVYALLGLYTKNVAPVEAFRNITGGAPVSEKAVLSLIIALRKDLGIDGEFAGLKEYPYFFLGHADEANPSA